MYRDMVATGQDMVRENILHRLGKVKEFNFESGKIDILSKSQGKLKQFNTALKAVISTIFYHNE